MQAPAVGHIENRRLFEAAAGIVKLEDRERQHLHNCEVCQSVFHVFISQPIGTKKKDPAA